jgi:hypothetical protein
MRPPDVITIDLEDKKDPNQDGETITLEELIQKDPGWAASIIKFLKEVNAKATIETITQISYLEKQIRILAQHLADNKLCPFKICSKKELKPECADCWLEFSKPINE